MSRSCASSVSVAKAVESRRTRQSAGGINNTAGRRHRDPTHVIYALRRLTGAQLGSETAASNLDQPLPTSPPNTAIPTFAACTVSYRSSPPWVAL